MIRLITCLIFVTGVNTAATAQFINLQLKVEPELSATVEQSLDFGTQIVNTGRTNISLGDVNMGVFSIRAFHTQNIYMSLSYPEYLINSNSQSADQIPLELSINYNNSGKNIPDKSIPLPDNNGFISVHERNSNTNRSDIWQELYIYVHGSIEVGNIANGLYTGDIILSIDYD